MAVAQHAMTQRSKGQGHKKHHSCMAAVLLLPVWDCTSYDCLGF